MARVGKRWAIWAAIGLIALHGAMLLASATSNSVTYDEFAHLPAGLSYWKYREFSVYNLSPPLLRMWGAWPAWIAGAKIPMAQPYRDLAAATRHWIYASDFGRENAAQYPRLIFLGRLPMIALSMAGACLIFNWARRLYGDVGGVLSCAMYALDPNFCAHGSILGTDVGFAIAMCLAVRCWISFCNQPTPRRAVVAAFTVALAHCCKTTGLLLWPILPVVFVLCRVGQKKRWTDLICGIGMSMLFTWVGINASFGFWKPFEPLGSFRFDSRLMQRIQRAVPYRTPALLARDFVRGFDAQKWEADGAYPTWFMGKISDVSSPVYYLVALGVKTPLATIALIATALVWRSGNPQVRGVERSILAAVLVTYVGLSFLMHINLGMRYLLPIFPLMFVFCGRIVAGQAKKISRGGAIVAGVLCVALFAENLAAAPKYFTSFNLLGGGPGRGYRIVSDSSFDWGQSLNDLRTWMAGSGVERVDFAYYGRADPAWYHIHYSTLLEPAGADYVAISQMFLTGIPLRMATPDGPSAFVEMLGAKNLRDVAPVARAGSIFIFRRKDYEAAGIELKIYPNN